MCILLNLISFISDIERCEMAFFQTMSSDVYPWRPGVHQHVRQLPRTSDWFSAGWLVQVRKPSNLSVFVPQHLDTQLDIGTVTWDGEDDMS